VGLQTEGLISKGAITGIKKTASKRAIPAQDDRERFSSTGEKAFKHRNKTTSKPEKLIMGGGGREGTINGGVCKREGG